jgi:hypothetical protein
MVKGDYTNLYFEDGTVRPLSTNDFVFEWGKFKDMKLSEVTDVSYLQWLSKSNQEKKPPDWYQETLVAMRLKELQHG